MSQVRSGYTKFASGDVIFAKITPCMENGKVAVVPEIPSGVGAGSTEFHVIQPGRVSAKFLYHWISQQWFRDEAEADMTGTAGQKRVSTDYLRAVPIPVPPPDTQRRIVDRIAELFAELDDGETALAGANADLETYRKSLLKAAVTGELTADWRTDNPPQETGEQLLQRILGERRARWEDLPKNSGKRYNAPLDHGSFDPPALPEHWTWASIDQLILGLRNGLSAKPNPAPPGLPILRISAVREMEVRPQEVRWLAEDVEASGSWVAPGDLLFTRYNGSPELVGVCGRYRGSEPVLHPDKLMRAAPVLNDECAFDYLELAANAGATRKFIATNTKTSAGQHGVSGESVKSAPVPLPPPDEMTQIVCVVHECMLAYAETSAELRAVEGSHWALRQSILSAAFRGELVQ